MNPELLEPSELDYELLIRRIINISTRRSKTLALSKVLVEEERGRSEAPKELPLEIDIEGEFKICHDGTSEILKELKQAMEDQNAWVISKCRSRLIHFQDRIGRLEPVNSFTMSAKNTAAANVQECSLIFKEPCRASNKTPKNPASAPKFNLGAIPKRIATAPLVDVSANQWGESLFGGRRSNVGKRTEVDKGISREENVCLGDADRGVILPTSSRIANPTENQFIESLENRNRFNDRILSDNLAGLRMSNHIDDTEHVASMPIRQQGREVLEHRHFQEFVYKRKPIPVHLWKASFSGEGDLHDFISQIDMFKLWEKTSDDDLLSSIGYLFTGRAAKWFKIHYRDFATWVVLKEAMKKEFLPSHSAYKLIEDIDKRYQKKNETFGEYLDAMLLMFSYMSFPLSEEHKLYMIRKNMDRTYSIALSSQVITSIAQLAEICKRMDDTKNMIDNRDNKSSDCSYKNPLPPQRDYRRINNVCELEADEREIMALEQMADHPNTRFALTRKDNPRQPQACWNCSKVGHNFNFCPDPISRFFCFRCGRPDVSSRRCPNCNKSGNDLART